MNETDFQLTNEIYEKPTLPERLKRAVIDEKIIVFYGAGVSRIIGCDGWRQMADRLIDKAYEKEQISFWEKEKIKKDYDPRKAISIIRELLSTEDYQSTLKQSLSIDEAKVKKYPIYESLLRLWGIYITTNIDDCFDSKYFIKEKIYSEISQFNTINLKRNSLFHLHGSINGKWTILTTRDYVDHYNTDSIKIFLQTIFKKDYLILFVGYNLNELEILDYLNLKGNNVSGSELRHIILLPFYKTEKELLRHEKNYFGKFGIEVIPYAIDKGGYEQLYDVLDIWEKEINGTSPFLYKSYEYIENSIKTFNREKALEVLQIIRNDNSFKMHLFEYIDNPQWFDILEEKGYFSAEQMPGPQPSKDKGYFTIPEWEVLRYLEKVAQKINDPGNDVYIDKILNVIRKVTEFCRTNAIENYRTWWFFAKILSYLPTKNIPIDIIELIPFWIESRFDTVLQGEAIAGKLINKFLQSPEQEDIQKAEKIFNYVFSTRKVKPEKEKRTWIRKNEYLLNIEPHWLEEMLNKNGTLIGEKCSIELIKHIATKIKHVLDKEESWAIVGNKNSYNINCSVKESSKLIIKMSKIIGKPPKIARDEFGLKWTPIGEIEVGITFNRIRSDEMCDLIVQSIEKDIKLKEILEDVTREQMVYGIQGMLLNLFRDGTYESFNKTFEVHSIHDALDMLTNALKVVLTVKAEKDSGMMKEILKMFLEDDYLYFIKMALYIMGRYPSYASVYIEHLKKDKYNVLLDGYSAGSELKQLLESLTELEPDELKFIEKKIELGPILYNSDDEYLNIWKQERYKALSHYEVFRNKYEEIKALTGYDAALHPAIGETEVGFVKEMSPVKPEEILTMSIPEIVQLFADYKPPERKIFTEHESVRGLGEMVSLAIQQKPYKFIDNLHEFINSGYFYVYEMLEGFKAAWEKKAELDINKIFDFIARYTDRAEFWDDKYIVKNDEWKVDHRGIIGALGELIQSGTRDDNWAFREESLGKIKNVLLQCLSKIEPSDKINDDPMTAVLNTYQGKIIRALMDLILRMARLEKQKGMERDSKWDDDVRIALENTLNAGIIDSYTLLGYYLAQLSYIDNKWVEKKIQELERIEDTRLWEAFMSGYLFNSMPYKDIFVLMQGHYKIALNYKFTNSHTKESLIQHIAVGYIRVKEDGESVYQQIFQQWNNEQIRQLARFYWMQREFIDNKSDDPEINKIKLRIVDEVKLFWKKVYDKYATKEKDEIAEDEKKLLSKMLNLTILLPEIDEENSKWLILAIAYVESDYNSAFAIEYLDILKDRGKNPQLSAELIGSIFLEMLKETTPTYKEEHIKSIVEFIYKYSKTKADSICIQFSSRGYKMLQNTWEEHNQDVGEQSG